MKSANISCLIATFILFLIPTTVYANMIWPALLLEGRILSWQIILIGLLIEYPFVRKLTHFSIIKSITADIVMNVLSSLSGIVLIPLSGIGWEFINYIILPSMGSFHLIGWIGTLIIATAVNALIEIFVLLQFKMKKMEVKSFIVGFMWLYIANFISVLLAMVSMLYNPPIY